MCYGALCRTDGIYPVKYRKMELEAILKSNTHTHIIEKERLDLLASGEDLHLKYI